MLFRLFLLAYTFFSSKFLGPALSNALVNQGLVNFEKLEKANPRDIEMVYPFQNIFLILVITILALNCE